MQQYQKFFKPCAIALCVLYLIFVLFLPYIVLKGEGSGLNLSVDMKFGNLMSGEIEIMGMKVKEDTMKSAWVILPLICGIAMAAAAALLPGKKAALVCAAGAIVALVTFWIVRSDLTDGASGANDVIKIGSGPILAMITGLIAAVVCWLSDGAPQTNRTPGVGRGNGNEW